MKTVLPLFTIAYAVVAGLFGIAGVVLMGFAFLELWAVVIEPEGQALPARAAIAMRVLAWLPSLSWRWKWRKRWQRRRS